MSLGVSSEVREKLEGVWMRQNTVVEALKVLHCEDNKVVHVKSKRWLTREAFAFGARIDELTIRKARLE